MPLYEYVCDDCHRPAELLIRGNEKPICPECGSKHLSKQFSVPAAHVRGGSLPVSGIEPGTCGRPACARGGCQGM
ncbi:MAG: zinc ribbon domain-containing protein [Pirellulales bacterium]|nr:zinc ribbon domain-containing protein [Pirellulales bacterium]